MASSKPVKKVEDEKVLTSPVSKEVKPKRSYVRKKPLTDVFVEFSDVQLSQDDLVSKAKSVLEDLGKDTEAKKFVFYVKPDERAIYFTIDGEGDGDYKILID